MKTLGLVRVAARAPRRDLLPALRARVADAHTDDHVHLELPAFGWPWRVAALGAACAPFFVPEPLRFLVASGLI